MIENNITEYFVEVETTEQDTLEGEGSALGLQNARSKDIENISVNFIKQDT